MAPFGKVELVVHLECGRIFTYNDLPHTIPQMAPDLASEDTRCLPKNIASRLAINTDIFFGTKTHKGILISCQQDPLSPNLG